MSASRSFGENLTRYEKNLVETAVAAAIWLVSAWVPTPARFYLWGLGLLIDFATPLAAGKLHPHQLPLGGWPSISSMPARFSP